MRRFLTSIVTFISWHRRAVGAVLAGAAVLIIGSSLRTPIPATSVVVVASALPAGHVLSKDDLSLRSLPDEGLPDATLAEVGEAVGRTLVADVSAGTVLQPGTLAVDYAVTPGRAIVPITVNDDALRALLSPGDRVSLVAQGPEGMEVLSHDARIVALPNTAPTGSQISAATQRPSTLILVEVGSDDAPIVASVGQGGGLTVIMGSV